MADGTGELPAVLVRILHRSAEQSGLMHELLGDAAHVDTGATQTPFGACSPGEKQTDRFQVPFISVYIWCLLSTRGERMNYLEVMAPRNRGQPLSVQAAPL